MEVTNASLPWSQASENNKQPILAVLQELLQPGDTVMEIGSGTGQHAAFFAGQLPDIRWQPTDQAEYLPGIQARVQHAALNNLPPPLLLDVRDADWQQIADTITPNHVFTANTAHIMHWSAVCAMFEGVARLLGTGCLIQYGPFNRNGEFTSPSNQQFDTSLRGGDPGMGIRNDAALNTLAASYGMTLAQDLDMPANNRMLIWKSAIAQ